MLPFPLPNVFRKIHNEEPADGGLAAKATRAASAITSIKSAVSTPETELRRWRRTFDANAKTTVQGEKCVMHHACLRMALTRDP